MVAQNDKELKKMNMDRSYSPEWWRRPKKIPRQKPSETALYSVVGLLVDHGRPGNVRWTKS